MVLRFGWFTVFFLLIINQQLSADGKLLRG